MNIIMNYDNPIHSNDNAPGDSCRYPSWCKSEAARFVWDQAQQSFCQHDGFFEKGKIEFLAMVLRGVSNEELKEFSENKDIFEGINYMASNIILENSDKAKEQRKNETINELIEKYLDFDENDPFRSIDAREELQERFKYQSHSDQIKTIKAFLEDDDDVSREWCYETMKQWWDGCLIPDIKAVWEKHKEKGCASIVAQRFPDEYVQKHKEALEEADYATACMRFGISEEDCYFNEFTRKEYFSVALHNHWQINDKEADELLFGFVLEIIDDESYIESDMGFSHFNSRCGGYFYTPGIDLEPSSYKDPSLLNIVDMPFYTESLAKMGKVSTLSKFYDWNEQIKTALVEDLVHGGINEKMGDGYKACLKAAWKQFMRLAYRHFPFNMKDFRKPHNKYGFVKDRKEYYPGYSWEDGLMI